MSKVHKLLSLVEQDKAYLNTFAKQIKHVFSKLSKGQQANMEVSIEGLMWKLRVPKQIHTELMDYLKQNWKSL